MKLNIRALLTLQFSLIVLFLLTIFTISIYYFSSSYRENEFYSRLNRRAITSAKLLLEVEEVGPDLLKIIDKNSSTGLFNEKVIIYNYKNEEIYNSSDSDKVLISKNLLDQIRLEKEVRYSKGEIEVLGLLYTDKYNRFVVIASALDRYGKSKLKNLQWILVIGFIISMILTVLLGLIYARRALKPMSDVVHQVDRITIASLNLRVHEGNGSDEIAQLAITFNNMLERLETAFEMQRSFVSNASHELRTPLTSITGQIEVSLMKERPINEYQNILTSVLDDIKNLNELSNGLLDLAKANSDISSITMQKLRIDELIWETREELLKRKPEYKINIIFDESVHVEKNLLVLGNEHLLKTAIVNLMDNACKYSEDKTVELYLSEKEYLLNVTFTDKGIGIDPSELLEIFQPFYRAHNVKNIHGNGLGLPLTEKIIQIHSGHLSIDSTLNEGTSVTISIPIFK